MQLSYYGSGRYVTIEFIGVCLNEFIYLLDSSFFLLVSSNFVFANTMHLVYSISLSHEINYTHVRDCWIYIYDTAFSEELC